MKIKYPKYNPTGTDDNFTQQLIESDRIQKQIISIGGTKNTVYGLDNFGQLYRLDDGFWLELKCDFVED